MTGTNGKKGTMIVLGCLAALICECCFGLSFMFSKKTISTVTPVYMLGWRFLLGSAFLGGCILTGLVKTRLRELKAYRLLPSALLFPGLYFVFETCGIQRTTASESGIVISSLPVATILLSALILKEKPFRQQVLGIGISIAGILCCIAAKGLSFQFDLPGYLSLFSAVFCFSGYAVLSRKFKEFTTFEKTFVIISTGAILFTAAALAHAVFSHEVETFVMLPFRDTDFLISIVYLGILCSGFSLFLCNFSISQIGATGFASFIGIETVVSILAGILILGESFSILQGVGATLVICGVYTANRRHCQK